jgi:cytochrome P450
MGFKWNPALREPDNVHQEIKKMLKKAVGPQRVGSHDPLLEDCTKELMLKFGSLQGDPIPLLVR